VVYEILQEKNGFTNRDENTEGGFFVEKVTPDLTDTFSRLMRVLNDNDKDELKILSKSIIKEIHFRLMLSKYGTRISRLGMVRSKTQRNWCFCYFKLLLQLIFRPAEFMIFLLKRSHAPSTSLSMVGSRALGRPFSKELGHFYFKPGHTL